MVVDSAASSLLGPHKLGGTQENKGRVHGPGEAGGISRYTEVPSGQALSRGRCVAMVACAPCWAAGGGGRQLCEVERTEPLPEGRPGREQAPHLTLPWVLQR